MKKTVPDKGNNEGAGVFLRFLYRTVPGRVLLRLLTARWISGAAGRFLDTKASRFLIKPFIRKNGIDPEDYEMDGLSCFNDCFTRKIKPGKRTFSGNGGDLCAPCDGYLSVYEINDGTVLPVKQSMFSVSSLLGDNGTAQYFSGGTCLVFRLCVENYHRYAFFDGGRVIKRKYIPGRLHTVRPIALENYPVFCENSREYTIIETENFGTAAYVEIGAMLVGKIKNHNIEKFSRGEEKGMFLYGGSTVIVLLEKGAATVRTEFCDGAEHPVKMGEKLN